MFTIKKADSLDFESLYEIMYQNMYQLQLALGLRWDSEGVKRHYRAKDNRVMKINGFIVGAFSIEVQENCLFIHTLQIRKPYQGKMLGYRAFKYILQEAYAVGAEYIKCGVFNNNSAKEVYYSIGFEKLNESNGILELQLSLNAKNNKFLNRLNT